MTEDDVDLGPDPNQVRRHAKRMLTEAEYRRKYRRIDFYRPNEKQQEFHNLHEPEIMLRAGNQQGKTHAAGAEMTFAALGSYPEWHKGRHFVKPPAIERPHDFMGWASCTSTSKVRDGAQLKLLGPVKEQDGLGTGLIPLDNILGKPAMARGIAELVDFVNIRREDDGKAVIHFKSYEMGREGFQGSPVDLNWLDEDVSRDDSSIYGECLARKTTTRGRIMCSLTPLLGMSPLRQRFKERAGGDCREILMTLHDCAVSKGGHIPDEDIPGIIAAYDEDERDTRVSGADLLGQGSVFKTPVALIKHTRDWTTFPTYWPWLWGLDFRHSGAIAKGHPFAAVLGAWDRDNDAIYVVHAFKLPGMAPMHAAAIKEHAMRLAPCAYPHDGGKGAGIITGDTVAETYKKLGLNMLPTHATFPTGGYGLEDGVQLMEERFASGRLKVAAHLSEWFDEYGGYHRKDGLIVKLADDLMSATRQLCMDIRFAKVVEHFRPARVIGAMPLVAAGTDFDLHTGR